MTDEKLIEEAAKAIYALDPDRQAWDGDAYGFLEPGAERGRKRAIAQAAVALAVFEKALTPTDADEVISKREALISEGRDWEGALESATARDIVRRLTNALAAGFRRTEVSEPSADERGDVNTAIDYLDELIGVYSHRVDVQRVLRWVIGRLRLPAPPKPTIHNDPDPLWDRLYGDGTQMMPPAKAPEPSAEHQKHADARRAETMTLISHSEPQGEPSDAPKVVTLDDVYEVTGLEALLAEARSRGEWCCENGCGSGACETCPCCSAGWCVSGVDGVPDDPEERERWLEVAAEHNPVAAALRAANEVR